MTSSTQEEDNLSRFEKKPEGEPVDKARLDSKLSQLKNQN